MTARRVVRTVAALGLWVFVCLRDLREGHLHLRSRSRPLEYLSRWWTSRLPRVKTEIGPDATGARLVFHTFSRTNRQHISVNFVLYQIGISGYYLRAVPESRRGAASGADSTRTTRSIGPQPAALLGIPISRVAEAVRKATMNRSAGLEFGGADP